MNARVRRAKVEVAALECIEQLAGAVVTRAHRPERKTQDARAASGVVRSGRLAVAHVARNLWKKSNNSVLTLSEWSNP